MTLVVLHSLTLTFTTIKMNEQKNSEKKNNVHSNTWGEKRWVVISIVSYCALWCVLHKNPAYIYIFPLHTRARSHAANSLVAFCIQCAARGIGKFANANIANDTRTSEAATNKYKFIYM